MPTNLVNRLRDAPELFHGTKILVIGDIALDRTLLCDAPVRPIDPLTKEDIFDITKDDRASLGAAYNTCALYQSLGVSSFLITATGDDREGSEVKELLANQPNVSHYVLEVPGCQTLFRLRLLRAEDGMYRLFLRASHEPDTSAIAQEMDRISQESEFQRRLRDELATSNGVFIIDRGKGVVSAQLLALLADLIQEVNAARAKSKRAPIKVVVIPAYDWPKLKGMPIDVLVTNNHYSTKAVHMENTDDIAAPANLEILATRLQDFFSGYFPRIVTTLRERGAGLFEFGKTTRLTCFPPINKPPGEFRVATHCGAVFASSVLLGLTLKETTLEATVSFANYVGSLQVQKRPGTKVALEDLLLRENLERFQESVRVESVDIGAPDASSRPRKLYVDGIEAGVPFDEGWVSRSELADYLDPKKYEIIVHESERRVTIRNVGTTEIDKMDTHAAGMLWLTLYGFEGHEIVFQEVWDLFKPISTNKEPLIHKAWHELNKLLGNELRSRLFGKRDKEAFPRKDNDLTASWIRPQKDKLKSALRNRVLASRKS